MSDSATPWTAACRTSQFFTLSLSLLILMPSDHLILCPLLVLLPLIFPNIRVFSNESVLRIRWPKYWSFIISPSDKYSGLMPFRIDWFDFLAFQGTLKSLLQHHSSKAYNWCISIHPKVSYISQQQSFNIITSYDFGNWLCLGYIVLLRGLSWGCNQTVAGTGVISKAFYISYSWWWWWQLMMAYVWNLNLILPCGLGFLSV